jgi:hypothetical protein
MANAGASVWIINPRIAHNQAIAGDHAAWSSIPS